MKCCVCLREPRTFICGRAWARSSHLDPSCQTLPNRCRGCGRKEAGEVVGTCTSGADGAGPAVSETSAGYIDELVRGPKEQKGSVTRLGKARGRREVGSGRATGPHLRPRRHLPLVDNDMSASATLENELLASVSTSRWSVYHIGPSCATCWRSMDAISCSARQQGVPPRAERHVVCSSQRLGVLLPV